MWGIITVRTDNTPYAAKEVVIFKQYNCDVCTISKTGKLCRKLSFGHFWSCLRYTDTNGDNVIRNAIRKNAVFIFD